MTKSAQLKVFHCYNVWEKDLGKFMESSVQMKI